MPNDYGLSRVIGLLAPNADQSAWQTVADSQGLTVDYVKAGGLLVDRPKSGQLPGDTFFATDTGTFYVWADTSWIGGMASVYTRSGAVVAAQDDYAVSQFSGLAALLIAYDAAGLLGRTTVTTSANHLQTDGANGTEWQADIISGDGTAQATLTPYTGQYFYRTDLDDPQVYNGTDWVTRQGWSEEFYPHQVADAAPSNSTIGGAGGPGHSVTSNTSFQQWEYSDFLPNASAHSIRPPLGATRIRVTMHATHGPPSGTFFRLECAGRPNETTWSAAQAVTVAAQSDDTPSRFVIFDGLLSSLSLTAGQAAELDVGRDPGHGDDTHSVNLDVHCVQTEYH